MIAEFASHNNPAGTVKGAPQKISKQAADVIPQADVIIIPLPSFTYPSVLQGIKDYLRPGQILCVTPGQGGFDWFAKEILGDDLLQQVVLMGLISVVDNNTHKFGNNVDTNVALVVGLVLLVCATPSVFDEFPLCVGIVEEECPSSSYDDEPSSLAD